MSTIVSSSTSAPQRQPPLVGRLFFLDLAAGAVLSANPDGTDLTTLIEEGRKLPDGLAIDIAVGHLYWTNMGNPKMNDGSILRSDLDGANLTTIVPPGGIFTPKQLQLEKASGHLYWCDREGMRVMRSNLDGSSIETLVDTSRGDARPGADPTKWCVGIAVDIGKGKFYWTQKGGDNAGQGSILRANITIPQGETAANRRDIELLYDGLPEPIDLDIDPVARMLYWTDRGDPPRGNTVNRAPLDVSAGERGTPEIVFDHLMEGIGLALDPKGGRMFVTDLGGSIYSANLDGTNRRTLQIALGNLSGIAYADVPATSGARAAASQKRGAARNDPAARQSARPPNKGATGPTPSRSNEAKPLPKPNSDFYQLVEVLTDDEKAVVRKVRTYMENKVQPIINTYWSDDAFPFELLASFKELGLGGLGFEGYGCAGGSQKLFGLVAMEIARVDASFCTFFGVHSGLAMGSIYLDGSEEQKEKWLPPMARWEKIGCFGLTEPLVGSGTSGGMTTTAKREGDTWILNGQKRWIGNAPWCDVSVIWARDVADNQVKGFIVENKTTPGFSVEKIEHKIALKVVQNGQITLKDVRVPEASRLQGGNSFRDTARVLRMTRYMVGWSSTGVQMGAFEAALKYTQERLQFGKPIASYQMVQDLLAKMLANVTACQCLMMRLAQLTDEGKLSDHQAALAKAFCTAKSRETVAWGRELLGGNGIVADYNVARFFADAEALYSYEGTYQMQNLIVGKAITGIGAFV